MPHPFGIWSLFPPVLAIVLAIWTRQVYLSLAAGIWIGNVVIDNSVIVGTMSAVESCVSVFADAGNTRVILFSILVGSLIALIQSSGGVDGFVHTLRNSRFVRGPRTAGLLAVAVGTCVFVESSISSMVTGTVARPIFDRLYLSREKLAYVCDTCSAPICMLIPLNGWGAFVLAQLTLLGVQDPVAVLVGAIPFNFYALVSFGMLLALLITGKDFGPMQTAQRRARDEKKLHRDGARPMMGDELIAIQPDPNLPARARNFVLPILWMVAVVPLGLAYTGINSLEEGVPLTFWNVLGACSGSTAVLWAVLSSVVFAGVLYRLQGIMKVDRWLEVSMQGASGLLPLGILMMLAFAIGRLCSADGLGTGGFVAGLIGDGVPRMLVVPVLFIIAGGIAFSTGTSWGTFAIMLAIAIPLGEQLGITQELLVAAVLSGGVFGDHCSPISDTTVVSSMAAASDHIDHVRTQLPYALSAGGVALLVFAFAGSWMT